MTAIADKWNLGPNAFVVSGDVAAVLEALAEWRNPWERNDRTGDITHPRLTYVVDPDGTIACAATWGSTQITERAAPAIRP